MNIRPSPIAGKWYPGQAKLLRETVEQLLNEAEQGLFSGEVMGLLAPHAGIRYSGSVAAAAFQSAAALRPEIVVIISPYHRAHIASLLTTAHDAYETPLGIVPVSKESLDMLEQALYTELGTGFTPIANDQEHAVEIELPFLQVLLDDFQLLPVMMRDQRIETALGLGQALASTLSGRHVLLVASSDLSHFYSESDAAVLDEELLRRVATMDPSAVIEAEQEGVGFACGRGAIAAMLWAVQKWGANQVHLLHYATSGDVSGDKESVVGYGAAAVVKSDAN